MLFPTNPLIGLDCWLLRCNVLIDDYVEQQYIYPNNDICRLLINIDQPIPYHISTHQNKTNPKFDVFSLRRPLFLLGFFSNARRMPLRLQVDDSIDLLELGSPAPKAHYVLQYRRSVWESELGWVDGLE